jgi:hypothetical protein
MRPLHALPALAVLLALAGLLALAPPAAAQDATLDTVARPTPVREHAGHVAYSRYDAAAQAYRLVVRAPDGRERTTPVPDAPEPHDVDLGPDSEGRLGLAVSLCGRPRGGDGRSGGCDLFLHTLGTDALRPVTNANTPDDERHPTIWRGKLAFTRTYGGAGEPIVYTKPIVAPRSRPSRRQAGVPSRACRAVLGPPGRCETERRAVHTLELYGRRLGQIVTYDVRDAAGFRQNEVRLVDVDTGSAELVAFMATGLGGQTYVGPSFAAGRLAWNKTCQGDPGGCFQNAGHFRYRYSAGTYERDAEREHVRGYAWTGRGTLEVRAPSGGEAETACGPGCPLVRSAEPSWEAVERRRVR